MSQQYKRPLVAVSGAVALLLVLLGIGVILHQSVISNGNKWQQALIADYNNTTNVLSDCLVKTKQSVGAITSQSATLDKVITDAVRGRYTLGTSAKPGSGSLFSAIGEAYPNLTGLSQTYNDVLVVINGCRTDFRSSQSRLQADVSSFESWRTGSWTTRTFGGSSYPTNALAINVAGQQVTGQAAIKQMRTLVVVSAAQSERNSGTMTNTNPFATSTTK